MMAGAEPSIGRTARFAGALYLLLVPLGIFSFVYVPAMLFKPGDPSATARNIMVSEGLFRARTLSHLISQVIVVFLAFLMYRLFKPVDKRQAMLMVVLAVLGVPISVMAESHNLAVLQLVDAAREGATADASLPSQVMFYLGQGRSTVLLAQVFWGLWLVMLGALLFRAGFVPKLIGIAVWIGAAGYLVDSGLHLLSPIGVTITQFTALGELLFPLWLLIRGISVERWQQAAEGPTAVVGAG